MTINLYLVRHGETFFNQVQKVQGFADSPLSHQAIQESLQLGEKLAHIPFDRAYSSDLKRAMDTLELILSKHEKKIPQESLSSLREICFGDFEGLYESDRKRILSEYFFDEEDLNRLETALANESIRVEDMMNAQAQVDQSEWAENYRDFQARILSAIEDILQQAEKRKEKQILLVSHGVAIYTLFDALGHPVKAKEIKNLSVSHIVYDQQGLRVKKAIKNIL